MNTSIGCSLRLLEATGVPTPLEPETQRPMAGSIKARYVRVSLMQQVAGRYQLINNAIQAPAIWEERNNDLWLLDDTLNPSQHLSTMLFRSTTNEGKQLVAQKAALVFELVILVQRGVDTATEMSCGWCELPIDELSTGMTHKLPIKGGTPMALTTIKQGDDHVDRSGIRFISKLFVGVEKCLEVEVTPFAKLPDNFKYHLNLMPSTCLLYTTLLHFMSGFMNYKADKLLS